MTAATLSEATLMDQLEQELKLIQGTNSIELSLSDRLGNQGKWCTITKECMPLC